MNKEDLEMMTNLAKNVAIYRTKAHLTAKKLSRMIGKPPDFIDKLERLKLKRVPALYVIIAISMVLDVGLNDLTKKRLYQEFIRGGLVEREDKTLRDIVISNIKYYREQAKMSQEDLSLRLGRKKDFIEKLEDKGMYKRLVTIVLLDDIAKILKVPTARFFDNTL